MGAGTSATASFEVRCCKIEQSKDALPPLYQRWELSGAAPTQVAETPGVIPLVKGKLSDYVEMRFEPTPEIGKPLLIHKLKAIRVTRPAEGPHGAYLIPVNLGAGVVDEAEFYGARIQEICDTAKEFNDKSADPCSIAMHWDCEGYRFWVVAMHPASFSANALEAIKEIEQKIIGPSYAEVAARKQLAQQMDLLYGGK